MQERKGASEGETVRIIAAGETQAALARYRLRATAHRIAAGCEHLLNEVDGPTREAWRDALGRSYLAARHLRSIVERWTSIDAGDRRVMPMEALATAIGAPRKELVDSLGSLLALIPATAVEDLLMRDARSLRETALGMLAAEDPAAARSPTPAGGVRAPARTNEQPRILLVDDDDFLRHQMGRALERLGYVTTLAQSGREALERAEVDSPDLIITDLSMPEMTGFELLTRLKAFEGTEHLPVIVVSGEGDADSVVTCLEQGAEDYITKPCEPVVLRARIRSVLERKRMRDLETAHLRKVALLMSAAEAVEQDAYDPALLAALRGQGDQLGQLARVFDRMVQGIRTRGEQLEARVRELRREMEQVPDEAEPVTLGSVSNRFEVGGVVAGRYEIRRELGKGGMGMVYLARDRELSEDVALKVVRRDVIGDDPSLLERLKSEMRLARRISHRNVVRSHDLGEWEGTYFLTMEYIKGVTVADLLARRGRLSVDSTLAIATQLADALAVAHGAGIIHRDIKPQNLLVDEEGALKVMDFGLARPIARSDGHTAAGFVVGTPKYMAMEQLSGGTVDARTDLFATGVVLYECLTGRVPFDGETPMRILARMMENSPRPVREIEPSVPAALAAAIEQLLQGDPERRFKSARELADRLALVG